MLSASVLLLDRLCLLLASIAVVYRGCPSFPPLPLCIYSPSWAHRHPLSYVIFRLVRSANKFDSETLAAYTLAIATPASDAALTLVQFSLGVPAYVYTLCVGLAVSFIIAKFLGAHRTFLGTIKHSMAAVLTTLLDKDVKEEEFPFPGGALHKL